MNKQTDNLLTALKRVTARLETVLHYINPEDPEVVFTTHPDLIAGKQAIKRAEGGK